MSARPLRLLSVLGMGTDKERPHYKPIVYSDPDGTPHGPATPLVQAALCRWLAPGSVHLLVTEEARARWEAPLLTTQLGAAPGTLVSLVDIPVGRDRDEQWAIFETVVKLLDETQAAGEDVCVDVTHGFRSLPMLVVSAVNFARARWRMRGREGGAQPNVRIVYGALEAGTKGADGRSVIEAPIFDLTGILGASDWADALRAFLSFGRADDLEALAKREDGSLWVDGFPKEQRSAARTMGERARKAADDFATARLGSLVTSSLPLFVGAIDGPDLELFRTKRSVFHETLRELAGELRTLGSPRLDTKDGLLAALRLAALLGRMQRYSEQVTLLRETAVTFFALRDGISAGFVEGVVDKAKRDAADHHFGAIAKSGQSGGELVRLAKMADRITALRNDVEHAGMRSNPTTAAKVRSGGKELVTELTALVEAWDGQPHPPPQVAPLFLNLSNHPTATWPEAQRLAAERIGPLADLLGGLPLVDPDLATKEVQALAKRIAGQALAQHPTAAAVFGEPVFSAALVHELEQAGVCCYAPAGRREVRSERVEGGAVHVERSFAFHAWRPYR